MGDIDSLGERGPADLTAARPAASASQLRRGLGVGTEPNDPDSRTSRRRPANSLDDAERTWEVHAPSCGQRFRCSPTSLSCGSARSSSGSVVAR